MSFSPHALSYCTNVHPGLTVAEVTSGLTRFSAPIAQKFGHPLAAGLWLACPVIEELQSNPQQLAALRSQLQQLNLNCYTLNAFPYGNFHSERVKEQVYLPDWTQDSRREYTLACARTLAGLLSANTEGSISTVPLGFKLLATSPRFIDDCAAQLLRLARDLADLHQTTGCLIRLAIEPEPCCVLETTLETIQFFQRLRQLADTASTRAAVEQHLGVCYDVCHQSVEFEDVAASIRSLAESHIRINKVHITNAIEVPQPGKNQAACISLMKYAEPRYLHQLFARKSDGQILHHIDLDAEFCVRPSTPFFTADAWRVHFHVPVDQETLGPLQTTRPDLIRALAAIRDLDYAPHLEVETYTWEVLPTGEKPDLITGFSRELTATRRLLTELNT